MNNLNPNWQYKRIGGGNFIPLSIIFDLASIIFGIYILISLRSYDFQSIEDLIIGIAFILLGLTHFYYKTKNYIFSETVEYTINKEEIIFKYGLFNKVVERIFINSIYKIDEVFEGASSTSIIIHSTKKINFKGLNKEFKELRPFPSIDRIPINKSPIKILRKQISSNDIPRLISEVENDLIIQNEGLDQTQYARRWNRGIAYLYLIIVSLIVLAFTDINLLNPIITEDVFIGSEYVTGGEGKQIYLKCKTEKGRTFRLYEIQGGNNYPIKLYESKLFGVIHHIQNKNKIISFTIAYGMITWIFPILGLYFLLAGIQILLNKGRIKSDDRGFLYIGPIASLFIIRICMEISGL